MAYCENCGTKLSAKANFCKHCGARVSNSSADGAKGITSEKSIEEESDDIRVEDFFEDEIRAEDFFA